jgi:alanine racemase
VRGQFAPACAGPPLADVRSGSCSYTVQGRAAGLVNHGASATAGVFSLADFPAVDPAAPAAQVPASSSGWVRVDLDALAANYRHLVRLAAPSKCAATVKADAYGLGLAPVVRRLAAEGCRSFFVANVGEGITVRECLGQAEVFVFNGVLPDTVETIEAAGLVPVLNCAQQVAWWRAHAQRLGRRGLPCALHVDTGMNRLGMSAEDVGQLVRQAGWSRGLDVRLIMTHLASAHRRDDPLTAQQVASFARLRRELPEAPHSIGNSAGTLLGGATRGDLVRPGLALYGGHPFEYGANPMREVVRVQGRVLQVRVVGAQTSVGYGGTWHARPGSRLATVGVGYADGYRRELGNRAHAAVGRRCVPVVGRVSMDLLTLDVSELAPDELEAGQAVDLLGGAVPLESVARAAGTVPYELLTGLGERLVRLYQGARG